MAPISSGPPARFNYYPKTPAQGVAWRAVAEVKASEGELPQRPQVGGQLTHKVLDLPFRHLLPHRGEDGPDLLLGLEGIHSQVVRDHLDEVLPSELAGRLAHVPLAPHQQIPELGGQLGLQVRRLLAKEPLLQHTEDRDGGTLRVFLVHLARGAEAVQEGLVGLAPPRLPPLLAQILLVHLRHVRLLGLTWTSHALPTTLAMPTRSAQSGRAYR